MALYRYRCPVHGDFVEYQPMSETTPTLGCPSVIATSEGWTAMCLIKSPKVLSGHLQFTYGRAEFKDGPELTGETVKETADRWVAQHRAEGRDPVPVGRGY